MIKQIKHLWMIGALTIQEIIKNLFCIILSFAPLNLLIYLPYFLSTDEKIRTILQIGIIILVTPFCIGVALTWTGIIDKIKANISEEKEEKTITKRST